MYIYIQYMIQSYDNVDNVVIIYTVALYGTIIRKFCTPRCAQAITIPAYCMLSLYVPSKSFESE